MTQIEQIEALDLTKILNKDIKSEIQKLIEEYNTAEDKHDFIEATKESATLILEMVADVYPEAIAEKEKPCIEVVVSSKEVAESKKQTKPTPKPKPTPTPTPKSKPKPKIGKKNKKVVVKKTETQKKTSKKKPIKKKPAIPTLSKLEALQKEVEECRKRGATRKGAKKNTPTIPKTVYDKVYGHINAIANLLPDRFKEDPEKVAALKRVSLQIHKKVVGVFEMNETLAEKGKLALKEKFKSMNQKIKTDDNK
ncbi:hypothetical protein ACFO3O_17435 [Dokdonia ponticola]|uniref:Uncharacterized protein n=1 Tax=Dokdonia ponticola TaxID=2041041 RepID=A0ABV9I0R7_9FLAO